MANSKKNKKPIPPVPDEEALARMHRRKQQLRQGIGLVFVVGGLFICFSIISYFFTWKTDQDKFFSNVNTFRFLLHDHSYIANWGGRSGAALAHVLVYKSAGVASLSIGIWLFMFGLSILYGKSAFRFLRYLRWLSITLLLVGPLLAYALPNSPFPYGGSWGTMAIDYLNGLFGHGGTGLMLGAISLFFIITLFALDLAPFLKHLHKASNQTYSSLKGAINTKNEVPAEVADTAENPASITSGKQKEDMPHAVLHEDPKAEEDWHLTLNERERLEQEKVLEEEENEELLEEFEINEKNDFQSHVANSEKEDIELSFEVIQQEEKPAIIAHGAHISIADNEPYAPELDLPDYKFPTIDLLEDRSQETIPFDKEELEKNKNQIIQTLKSFGIEIQRISATVGPTVTLYEIVPSEGVRISKIRNLEDDIALNLAALGIRIIAPIPGRGTIGIEVPNANKQMVSMRALITSEKFVNNKMSLPIALGKKIDNENYIVDLATMPHLLMAGATGQGKSVGINTILVSLLYKKHPSHIKFVMVDPKKVELSIYRVIEKHFLAKLPNEEEAIITDTKKVIYTLNALCIEMDNRYELLKEANARNIKEYNEKFINRRLNPEKGHKYLPFIILVIDEFADIIMTAGKEVEMPIARLSQLARAVGIHLIIATQRPSVNVITGTIKANFPARIAFKVSAKVDSRTILDSGGAEQLIGRGDMLVSHGSELLRLQCAFVDTPEVERIVDFIGRQRGYASAFELPEYEGDEESNEKTVDLTNRDKLFEECARLVVQTQNGATSNLQRRFNLGYNRAGRIMDQLEAAGIVGPAVGSKPRDVYFKTEAELNEFLSTL
jgi:S-DNA-T family DNA segregation ATPase FtsK/SpoIIIE